MDTETTTSPQPRSRFTFKMFASIFIVLALIAVATYSLRHVTPEKVAAMQDARLLQSVGKLMIIPNEQPVVATINQADVLTKEQPFYAGSQNGDKLLIFPKSQKAIIYSPSRNVIVNSGPFVVNSGTTPASQTPAASK